jgi:16S rRNA A1518/A1519 N6-dimethyltransferase RsmA/KsgA/DIM1 with predicted DNA glycosylase/AP lyase activity
LKDEKGYQTLEVIAKADKLNQWIFETIRPYCHGNILEIGSGIGNISRFFIQNGYSITLSDTDEYYIDQLKKTFKGNQCPSNRPCT